MKEQNFGDFYHKLSWKKDHFPFSGLIELTYRCQYNCVHCYCQGINSKELTTAEWKKVLDEIHREGCIHLTISGGDPLIREDFLEIYAYAKSKGFMICLFTNGYGLTPEIIDYLVNSPPYSIEITLNGITGKTYEAITGVPGSFVKIINTLNLLSEKKIPLILKTNCMKKNKNEVGQIKAWTEKLLGTLTRKKLRPRKVLVRGRWHFKYDPMIYPRLSGDKAPCRQRLSFAELEEVKKQDVDIWAEYERGLHSDLPDIGEDKDFLYRCNSWMKQFFINPEGRLKFCEFSDKFSVDLKTVSFREGFYRMPQKILNEKFKTDSKCRDCRLRPICYHCPARAYLETGDEEAPVEYYCQLAEESAKRLRGKKEE